MRKYGILYDEELPRFRKEPLNIYELPFFDTPQKIYNGAGRMELDLPDKHKKKLAKQEKQIVDIVCRAFSRIRQGI